MLPVLRAMKSWRESHALSCGCWPAQVVTPAAGSEATTPGTRTPAPEAEDPTQPAASAGHEAPGHGSVDRRAGTGSLEAGAGGAGPASLESALGAPPAAADPAPGANGAVSQAADVTAGGSGAAAAAAAETASIAASDASPHGWGTAGTAPDTAPDAGLVHGGSWGGADPDLGGSQPGPSHGTAAEEAARPLAGPEPEPGAAADAHEVLEPAAADADASDTRGVSNQRVEAEPGHGASESHVDGAGSPPKADGPAAEPAFGTGAEPAAAASCRSSSTAGQGKRQDAAAGPRVLSAASPAPAGTPPAAAQAPAPPSAPSTAASIDVPAAPPPAAPSAVAAAAAAAPDLVALVVSLREQLAARDEALERSAAQASELQEVRPHVWSHMGTRGLPMGFASHGPHVQL